MQAACRSNSFYSLPVPSWGALRKSLQPLAKRVCDAARLHCSRTCLNSADVGFVLDGSSSVGSGNFRTLLRFIANLSQEFRISDTDTRVGLVQYTYEQRLEFGFDAHRTKAAVLRALGAVGYWSGGTSTGAAISFALQQLFQKSKPSKRKLMILITDGRSYDDIRAPALAAHRMGERAPAPPRQGSGEGLRVFCPSFTALTAARDWGCRGCRSSQGKFTPWLLSVEHPGRRTRRARQ